jgi:hypothetical protein
MSMSFRKAAPSRSSMYLVTYDDGRTAYFWLDAQARVDDLRLVTVARERQAAGALPDGEIRSVRAVR